MNFMFKNNRIHIIFFLLILKPLVECHSFLKQSKRALHIELSDSFLREYQARSVLCLKNDSISKGCKKVLKLKISFTKRSCQPIN